MKLSDIKGKRQIKVVGKLLELASLLKDDEAFEAFVASVKDGGKDNLDTAAMLKLGPILMRDDVVDGIVGVIAYAKGVSPDEVDNPVGEFMELVTSDMELPAFLSEAR